LPQLDHDPVSDIGTLEWDDLVLFKRKLSAFIREVTHEIVDIDTTTLPRLNKEIHEEKTELNEFIVKSKQNRMSVQSVNSDLLSLSEKIRQSKNFLGIMQNRLPHEKEETLQHISNSNKSLILSRSYGTIREKDQILSKISDASMKIDALRAFQTIRGQLQDLESQCEEKKKSIRTLDNESQLLHTAVSKCKKKIQSLYDSKHQVIAERGDRLTKYSQISLQLEKVNAQLDLLAEARRRQRQDNFRPVYSANFSKAKELAKKKLQSGAKLSLEELRLLYNENE
jgi:uncharacterized coiled-coil DUF342 family protein